MSLLKSRRMRLLKTDAVQSSHARNGRFIGIAGVFTQVSHLLDVLEQLCLRAGQEETQQIEDVRPLGSIHQSKIAAGIVNVEASVGAQLNGAVLRGGRSHVDLGACEKMVEHSY